MLLDRIRKSTFASHQTRHPCHPDPPKFPFGRRSTVGARMHCSSDSRPTTHRRRVPWGISRPIETVLRTRDSSLGFVRVRANAVWPSSDLSNVIGQLLPHTWVRGEGPLKNADGSAGIGYAIAVVDREGHHCRGYLHEGVVDVIESLW